MEARRAGGRRDESEIYIDYSREELMRMLARQRRHFKSIGNKKPKIRKHK